MSSDFEILLPKLGESILSATVVSWFKKEGDFIKKDEPLLEVATDKVNSEIPSPVSGVLKKIHAQPDQELNVGAVLATIAKEGSSPAETAPSAGAEDYYSPAVLRLAREKNIPFEELSKMKGSGAGGRVTKTDIENYNPMPCSAAPAEGTEHIKMSGMRKAIADNLVRSFYAAPHASLVTEVDVTTIVRTIKQEKENFQKKYGAKLSVTAFVAQAIAKALQEFPWLNASLREDTIVVKHFVNIGVAVSVDQGIMVPVVRGCQNLSLPEIAVAIGDFAQKARTGTLSPDDVKEGTITLTNFGMTGVQIGIPIIRYPEVAIVGMGAIDKKVVVREDGAFEAADIMHVSLTFDHRVIDGIYGCGFLNALKNHLEKDAET
ncbi:MAG: 2-oxo acid dehydrogenase subunit E2 [Verrucomicrobia bacterium]|nr:2-oxo acid dehydrogenase subunit E2 [Verrucomicrobiota bacterium]